MKTDLKERSLIIEMVSRRQFVKQKRPLKIKYSAEELNSLHL